MKIPVIKIKNIKIVPESIIIDCAAQFGPDEENNFKKLLDIGNEYKKAGLNPIYLANAEMKDIDVTTEEKLNRLYN